MLIGVGQNSQNRTVIFDPDRYGQSFYQKQQFVHHKPACSASHSI